MSPLKFSYCLFSPLEQNPEINPAMCTFNNNYAHGYMCMRKQLSVGKGSSHSLAYLAHVELVYSISYDVAIILHDVGECSCLLGCMEIKPYLIIIPKAGKTYT